jgi:plasmid stabilization system protein ParE
MVNRYLLSHSAKEDLDNIFSYVSKELKSVENAP